MKDLNFDRQKSLVGTFTAEGVTYNCYRTFYCAKPIEGLFWKSQVPGTEIPSEEFFKLNIKVRADLSPEEESKAQILVYNPWGGDMGQTPSAPETLDNAQKIAVLRAGWILVEPGMRGNNCYTGTIGGEDYQSYSKLPRPLADLKAAIRYLRYEGNMESIPGDKDRIWIAGTSSGGCASSIIGTSGDSEMFLPYLREIGAAETSDAVYGSAPSCPVMNRANGDAALSWERWSDLSKYENVDEYTRYLYDYYPGYFDSLGLRAEKNVPEAGIQKGDLLTSDRLRSYLYSYVKEAALYFFRKLGNKDAIDKYLAEDKPGDFMYGSDPMPKTWIRPVFDDNGNVTDIRGSYDDFWRYTSSDKFYDPAKTINWQFDKVWSAPDEMQEGNGVVNAGIGFGFISAWGSPSSFSFGKPTDHAAAYSEAGQKWLTDRRGIPISDEYRELIALQRNSVNPMHFILDPDTNTKIAQRWFLRTGTVDLVTPHPNFIALGTALMNAGKDVDIAFVWDQVHGLTSEIEEFMNFAQ